MLVFQMLHVHVLLFFFLENIVHKGMIQAYIVIVSMQFRLLSLILVLINQMCTVQQTNSKTDMYMCSIWAVCFSVLLANHIASLLHSLIVLLLLSKNRKSGSQDCLLHFF